MLEPYNLEHFGNSFCEKKKTHAREVQEKNGTL